MAKLTVESLNQQISELEIGERMTLENVPEEIYHAVEGIGSTLLTAASKSMANYVAARDHTQEFTPATERAFVVGSAAHCLILEPELFDEKFILQPPEITRRGTKAWKEFVSQNEGKGILDAKEMAKVDGMVNAVMDECGKFFVGGQPEKSYWYKHETGLILKARTDYQVGDAVIDLKTDKADSPRKFANKVKYDLKYQDALYRLVTGLPDMIFICASKSAPYPVFITQQGELPRKYAEIEMEQTLKDLAFAIETEDFPNIPVELIVTELTQAEIQRLNA